MNRRGLGLQFIAVALRWASLSEPPRRLTHLAWPRTLAGGLVTVALGALIAAGAYSHLTAYLMQLSKPR